jgi:hypothetical protein
LSSFVKFSKLVSFTHKISAFENSFSQSDKDKISPIFNHLSSLILQVVSFIFFKISSIKLEENFSFFILNLYKYIFLYYTKNDFYVKLVFRLKLYNNFEFLFFKDKILKILYKIKKSNSC